MGISKSLVARELSQDVVNKVATATTQQQYEVWTGIMPDGTKCPGFVLDFKENLIAYCIPRAIIKKFNLRALTKINPPDSKKIISSRETKLEILKRELVRVYISTGRTKNVKDRPRAEDYWVAMDYAERGIWYGHLVPKADTEKQGKYSVPVGTSAGANRSIPAGNSVKGDAGGDPAGNYGTSMSKQMNRLQLLIADVSAGSKIYGTGQAHPAENATVITSNDGTSSTALRVEAGAIHADQAGRNSDYRPTQYNDPDRFNTPYCEKCNAGIPPEEPVDPLLQQYNEENK
jgi:hypothetical protein